MSNLFPTHSRSVHTSPPSSPQNAGSRSPLDRGESGRQNQAAKGRPNEPQARDRRNDDSYYERRPKSYRDPEEPGSPSRGASSFLSRYDQPDDTFLSENAEWIRKSSRQRRFTQTTLPSLHTREQIAREETNFDDTERDAILGEMNERMLDMSGFVQSVIQRKEEDLKLFAEMFDEEGRPIPRYDENGNLIPPHDEDGYSIDGWDRDEEDRKKTKTVTLDTSKLSIKEGWLWKKGSGNGLLSRTNWTRRYFKFDLFQVVTIFYFKQEMPNCSEIRPSETKEQYAKRKKSFFNAQKQYARGFVKLMKATLNVPEPRLHRNLNINPNWVFQVVIPNSRTFTLCAESQEDFERWTQSIGYITGEIQKALNDKTGPRGPKPGFDEKKRDAALCVTAYGKGLFEAVAGHQSEFTIQGFDFAEGVPATSGGQRITAVLESRDLHYDLPVKDNQDGTYTVVFTPTRVGTYELSIMLDDYDIQGSPFHPSVRPAPVSAPHCIADGAGLFCAVVGAVNRFNIHTRNAFNQIVVARGVPFDVQVEPPLILCNFDGSPLLNQSDWRPHDNGNGTYAVAYTVDLTPELSDKLNRGEHFEGTINVLLDDHIYSPSFPRSIKGAPFHPVLAASATGAALASAARHAALLLGPAEYNDFVASYLVQNSNSPSAFDPTRRFSELRMQVPPSMNASNTTTNSNAQLPSEPSLVEESSSFYVKDSPIPRTTIPRERPNNDSFASTTMRQQSFMNDSSPSFQQPQQLQQQQQSSYLPVQRSRQKSTSFAPNAGPLSPEQREALDNEREELLRLRKELLEGKHMVDEQVNRIAFLESRAAQQQGQRGKRSFGASQTDDDSFAIPPPPYQHSHKHSSPSTSKQSRSLSSSSLYQNPPQRPPPTGSANSFTQGQSSASLTLERVGNFDQSVQALFARHAPALKRIFRHYATRDAGKEGVSMASFNKCLVDFGIKPTFASKKDIQDAFLQASGGDPACLAGLTMFVEQLANVAMIALSKPTFASLYPTPLKKMEVLLGLWGLGDSETFENVLQKQRFVRGL